MKKYGNLGEGSVNLAYAAAKTGKNNLNRIRI